MTNDKKNESNSKKKHNTSKSKHHKKMIKDFRLRFFISLVLTIPVIFLSPTIQEWLNYEITFLYKNYVLLGLASIIFIFGGWPFFKGLVKEIKKKAPGMMTLIALAITVAYVYSVAVVIGLSGTFFFWELVTLIDIMLLGHWLEMRSILGASQALEELVKLLPSEAHKIKENGETEDIPLEKIQKGDILLIKPGEKIPSDGVIIKGESAINEAMLTGESNPVNKIESDEIIGGSINGEGSLHVRVEKTGKDSYISQVITLVEEAQATKSKTQNLADKAALVLTIISISIGIVTLTVWLILGETIAYSIERMATVMVITCPHALGLAIPLVVAVSTSLSAKNGLLIRNRTAFENSRKITKVIFDKTGTLTEGVFSVNEIIVFNKQYSKEDLISYAASLEKNSEHPIATGILKKARELDLKLNTVDDFKALKGKGITGTINDRKMKVVSPGYLKENKITIPNYEMNEDIGTSVFVLINEDLVGVINLSDKIREESFEAISDLQKEGIECWMLTGDNEKIAKNVSDKLGLDGYFAEVLPHEKQETIKNLQRENQFIAMTGDGVNDAPALAQADVGIAIGSGTDVAAETADIILVNSNPKDVTSLIKFGKATYGKMVQNLIWATGYNVIAIPLAAGVLASLNFVISPAIGAILMSLSTIIVAINAKLLKVD
ncbi:MAG: cadmium-translocating P-type ATPase [Candidatus Lokiarchaeota archaeon]|nr:cadmium-translocating P-type ATPase [Candidatus Lokiarchaeota archaeon]